MLVCVVRKGFLRAHAECALFELCTHPLRRFVAGIRQEREKYILITQKDNRRLEQQCELTSK